jgi:hypothetical protein
MAAVRIARVEPWPGEQPGGQFMIHSFLVVLADDEGGRSLPVWLRGPDGHGLWRAAGTPPPGRPVLPEPAEALTLELLSATGGTVLGVDIDELDAGMLTPPESPSPGPRATTGRARIEVGGPAGPRTTTARLGYALALAAGSGAPVRVAGAVLDRLALAVAADDPSLSVPAERRAPEPGPRFEPRNLGFTDGLAGWDFGGSFREQGGPEHHGDYACSAAGGVAALTAAVAEPYGFAALAQTSFAEDYEGQTVVFRAEVRTAGVTGEAGLYVRAGLPSGPVSAPGALTAPLEGDRDWTAQEITARIPVEAGAIQFGLVLRGAGRAEVRGAGLTVGR